MTKSDFVSKNPEVAKWVEDMNSRGKSGQPLKTGESLVANFKTICDIMKLNPSAFAVSQEVNKKLLQELRDQLKVINPRLREGGWGRYAKTIRNSPCLRIAWERNMAPAIASGKKSNFGAYSTMYATDSQPRGDNQLCRRSLLARCQHGDPDRARSRVSEGREAPNIKVGDIHFRQRNGFEVVEFEVYEGKDRHCLAQTSARSPSRKGDQVAYRREESRVLPSGNGSPMTRKELAQALRSLWFCGDGCFQRGEREDDQLLEDEPIARDAAHNR